MRIALTLDRDAVGRERNDYVTSLLGAGFRRDEIEVLGPGASPSDPLDGLVLGGGCDVDPERYGQTVKENARLEIDPGRDALDFTLLDKRGATGPRLAICRGLQVVNVALGGTLIQDVPSEPESPIAHESKADKTRIEHAVLRLGGDPPRRDFGPHRASRQQPPSPGHRTTRARTGRLGGRPRRSRRSGRGRAWSLARGSAVAPGESRRGWRRGVPPALRGVRPGRAGALCDEENGNRNDEADSGRRVPRAGSGRLG